MDWGVHLRLNLTIIRQLLSHTRAQLQALEGINRDIFTMGARPIAQLNSLRFR